MLSDHERWAAEIIAFYTAPLPAAIIDSELDFFAAYYLDSARECLCPTGCGFVAPTSLIEVRI
jgi:hypothetical protein